LKKIIFPIIGLLLGITFIVWAGTNPYILGTSGPGVAAHCASCNPGDPADIMCEDFEGTVGEGTTCTWIDDHDANPDHSDPNATHVAGFACTDKGNYALQVDMDTNGDQFTYTDLGVGKPTAYYQWYMVVISEEIEDEDREELAYLSIVTDMTVMAVRMAIVQAIGGQISLRIEYREDGAFSFYEWEYTLGTWFRIGIFHDTIGDVFELWLDGVRVVNDTDAGDKQRDPRYIGLGSQVSTAVDAVVAQYDNLRVDDDTMPPACTE